MHYGICANRLLFDCIIWCLLHKKCDCNILRFFFCFEAKCHDSYCHTYVQTKILGIIVKYKFYSHFFKMMFFDQIVSSREYSFQASLHLFISSFSHCESNQCICDPLPQNPEQGSFVTFSTINIKWTTSNQALKWHQDHVCSINISEDMADFVSGIYIFLLHYTS